MSDNINDIEYQKKPGNGKVFVGLVLLVVGGILLLNQFDELDIPGWIWSWPTWVIVWALYSGSKHNFRNSTWIIFLFVGLLILVFGPGKFALDMLLNRIIRKRIPGAEVRLVP